MNPALLDYIQAQNMQNAPANPFDSGISRAIESARQSLGMTQKQQDKAFNRALLNFAANISKEPKQRGLLGNFAAVSRAAIPAISEYDSAEEEYERQNNALANQMIAYQKQEQQRQLQLEELAYKRHMEQERLAELKRYHDMQMQLKHDKFATNNPTSPLGSEFIPIESKSERLMYSKDKKASGEILQELNSIAKDYNELKELTENDLIGPMTPYGVGTTANKAKDFFSYFGNKKEERKKTIKRKALEAKVGKFQAELERKVKGGMLTKGMIELFENKDLLPSMTNAPDIFEAKMDNLTHEMQERYQAADASLRYNAHISPYDLKELEARLNPQEPVETQSISIPSESEETVFDDRYFKPIE